MLIVSGHTHSLVDATIAGIPVVQAYYSGSAIDVVDLGPDSTTHVVRSVLTDSIAPDPAVATVVREEVARVAPIVSRRVATIAEPLATRRAAVSAGEPDRRRDARRGAG